MQSRTYTTFREFLEDGEELTLDRSVLDVLNQMERENWMPQRRTQRGIRYFCPCEKQHNQFIDLRPIDEDRLDFLLTHTCFKFTN